MPDLGRERAREHLQLSGYVGAAPVTLQQYTEVTKKQTVRKMAVNREAMARAEDQEHAMRRSEVNLAELAMETVRDFVPRAMDKRIDLGYAQIGPVQASSSQLGPAQVGKRQVGTSQVSSA